VNGPANDKDAPGAAGAGTTAGWFGKLACLGDFASRRLAPEFTQACDAWLSRCVEASRAQLGERWLDAYLTSPLWRFAWAPGVLDARWWFGVMMPSVDQVGRYFPLLVAQPCLEAPRSGPDLDRLERWFEQLADAALATLQPGATLERFESALAATPPWQMPTAPRAAQLVIGAPKQWPDRSRHAVPAGMTLAQSLQQVGTFDTLRRFQGCSVWWPSRPGGNDGSLSVAVGLPAASSFVHLLEGAW
jgi:type VI secretion system protein ImpM